MPFEVTNYLHMLARRLHLDPAEKDEIIQELEAHLEDKTAELETQGIDHDAAVARAVQEMGAPEIVVTNFPILSSECHQSVGPERGLSNIFQTSHLAHNCFRYIQIQLHPHKAQKEL